jgi:hypothetical protein
MKDFISRHWRGEYSLPRAYWLNGVVITYIAVIVCAVASSLLMAFLLGFMDKPYRDDAFLPLFYVLAFPIVVWGSVGAWRSATHHHNRFWGRTAKVFIVLGWLSNLGQTSKEFDHTIATRAPDVTKAPESEGMSFAYKLLSEGKVMVYMHGDIETGDSERLKTWINNNIGQQPIVGFSLDSRGGNIGEALALAKIVKALKIATIVYPKHNCVSACFFIFAAGNERFAYNQSRIGVHSLYLKDKGENADAKETTVNLARLADEQFNIPASIIGKMVATPPEKVYVLNRTDLAEMGVRIFDEQPPTAITPQPASSSALGGAVASSTPPTPAQSPAFRKSLGDRTAWENWVTGLTGSFRAGALYWAKQRSSPNPGGCEGNNAEFSAGCNEARVRLNPSDALRKSDSEYRAGWNSYGH